MSGLSAGGLTLTDNGGDSLSVPPGTTDFAFATALSSGTAYDVAVATQPSGESCTVVSGSGTISDSDVTNIQIACTLSASRGAQVSILAGSGSAGDNDGQGSAASFNDPVGVAVDSAGNVYVTDFMNNDIRKITPTGVVTTFAGSGVQGESDGVGTAATFSQPFGIAVDSAANVYVTDNSGIRQITPGQMVTTVAFPSTGLALDFSYPGSIAVDANGDLYFEETGQAYELSSTDVLTMLASSIGDGGLAVNSQGALYTVVNGQIDIVSPQGQVVTLPPSLNSLGGADGLGSDPDIAVDSNDNVYATDANSALEKFTAATSQWMTLVGGSSWPSTYPACPGGVAVDFMGNVYVADSCNDVIYKVTQ